MSREIEDAFQTLTKVVLLRPLYSHSQYAKWLYENVRPPHESKSAKSGKAVFSDIPSYFPLVGKKALKMEEGPEYGKLKITAEDVRKLSLSNAPSLLGKISYYSPEVIFGENMGVEECGQYADTQHGFHGSSFIYCKYVAYAYWPARSEYIFGCDTTMNSKFCLKCYNSDGLTRCFEVSQSSNCSDCYFCHNCEGLQDCMFCFNVKSMKHAIGNVAYPKEEYMRLKNLLLSEIAEKLEAEKRLGMNIFNIGCRE